MRSQVLTSVAVALTLLGMTACSDSKSASTTVIGTSVPSLASTPNSTLDTTLDTTVVTAVGSDDEIRQQILAQVMEFGNKAGYKLDQACVVGIVAQLSAADLQEFRKNFNSPAVSPEGNALGNKILSCDPSQPTSTS